MHDQHSQLGTSMNSLHKMEEERDILNHLYQEKHRNSEQQIEELESLLRQRDKEWSELKTIKDKQDNQAKLRTSKMFGRGFDMLKVI